MLGAAIVPEATKSSGIGARVSYPIPSDLSLVESRVEAVSNEEASGDGPAALMGVEEGILAGYSPASGPRVVLPLRLAAEAGLRRP